MDEAFRHRVNLQIYEVYHLQHVPSGVDEVDVV